MQNLGETKGCAALRKLQNNEFKIWTKEEIRNSNIGDTSKEILFYIAKHNSFRAIPSSMEIKKKFNLPTNHIVFRPICYEEMAFSVTIPEIVRHYGTEYLGKHMSHFSPPDHLKWLKLYLEEPSKDRGKGKGGALSWDEKIRPENVRSTVYPIYWVALLKHENDKPCYEPLGLHIPKPEVRKI